MRETGTKRSGGDSFHAKLVGHSGEHARLDVPVEAERLLIGRGERCDIQVPDPLVSGRHAELVRGREGYVLRDLGSRNGTFVNGSRVTECVLGADDEIRLGKTMLLLKRTGPVVGEDTVKMKIPVAQLATPGKTLEGDIAPSTGDLAQRLAVMQRMSTALNTTLSLDVLVARAADLLVSTVALDRAYVLLHEGSRLVTKAVREKPDAPRAGAGPSKSILEEVVREMRAVITRDARRDPRFGRRDSVRAGGVRSALSMPLKVEGRLLGVVHLERGQARPFTEEDLHLVALICNHAAANIRNAQLFGELNRTNEELIDTYEKLHAAQQEVLGLNRDLERKVEARTREKDELLGMVAHDMRSPLTGILGFLSLAELDLTDGESTGRIAEGIQSAAKLCQETVDLLNDLLDVSAIESGRITVRRRLAPLGPGLVAFHRTWSVLAQTKGIDFRLELPSDLPAVPHDERRIAQVLNNLVLNAIKFTQRGDAITLSAARVGGEVQVRISDTGPGIPAADLGRIFGRFEQSEAPARQGEVGKGLGLAIVKKLVELHEGRVWVDSQRGVGSCFTFTLPLEMGPAEAADAATLRIEPS